MKRLFSAALSLLIFFTVAACGGPDIPLTEALLQHEIKEFKAPFPGGEGWDRMYLGKSDIMPGLSELMSMAKKDANVHSASRFFKDDLFIGDSRTVGLKQYSGMEDPDFFCATGMSVFNIYYSTAKIDGEEMDFDTLLKTKSYNRIFVMLGINELAHSTDEIAEKYGQLLDYIIVSQPNSRVYVQYNLHVTVDRSSVDPKYNNVRINELNGKIKDLADARRLAVLDVNSLFDDKNGHLNSAYTFDHTHVVGKYYKAWGLWLYFSLSLTEV